MANRSSSPRRADVSGPPRKPGLKGRAYIAVAALVCLVSIVASAQGPVEQAAASPDAAARQAEALARRAADRIAALQREAESLAGQERTLLGELRKLEIDRQIRMERLNGIEREAAGVRSKLADATTRATALAGQAEQQRPDIEARLVRLYKL